MMGHKISKSEPAPWKAIWPQGYEIFFMLNSAEHEILDARKLKKNQEIQHLSGSDTPKMQFVPLINVKMPTIVGILTFMSKKNFLLSWVEHENFFITSGVDLGILCVPGSSVEINRKTVAVVSTNLSHTLIPLFAIFKER